MLTNFFSKTKPITIVVILALFLCYYGIAFFTNVNGTDDFKVVPLFFLMLGLVTFIDIKNELTFDNSYTLLFYVIIVGAFSSVFLIDKTFYSCITLLLFSRKVYSLQAMTNIAKKLFDAGFWLSITFILEPFSILFVVMLYASIILHQRLSIENIIIPLVGLFVPLFLYYTFWFWNDNLDCFYNLFQWYSSYEISVFSKTNYFIAFCFIGVLTLLSIILKTPKALAVLNTFRSSWVLILVNFVCVFFLVLLIEDKTENEVIYLCFPLALILANGLELFEKKRFVDLITIPCIVLPIILAFV